MNAFMFIATVWVNLFVGGNFNVYTTPNEYTVNIEVLPQFNWQSYGHTNLDHNNYKFEYEYICVHIINGRSYLQTVITYDEKVLFKRYDAELVVFTVIYRPVGKLKSNGDGSRTVIGQIKMVVPSNQPFGNSLQNITKP